MALCFRACASRANMELEADEAEERAADMPKPYGFGQSRPRYRGRLRTLFRLEALAPSTSCLAHLLPTLDGRLHVVPSALELAQDAFGCHLALEMLDCALDAFVADLDFEGLTLDGFARISQGPRHMADHSRERKCKLEPGCLMMRGYGLPGSRHRMAP